MWKSSKVLSHRIAFSGGTRQIGVDLFSNFYLLNFQRAFSNTIGSAYSI
jgi:hypothetical protein